MARPILSAFADEYKTEFDGQIEGLKKHGIGFIEIRHVDGRNISTLTLEEVSELKKKLDGNNIRVSSIGSPLGKIKTSDDMDAEMARTEHICKIANILEAKCIRMFSFYPDESKSAEENKAIVYSSLERMLGIAKKYGVTLCHENEARIYGESPEACREILDHFGGELKCVFDMGNFALEGYKPYPHAYDLLKEYIEYFHIKDSLAAGAIVPPGCGEAKIAEILKDFGEYTDKDFIISLEPHLQTFSGLHALVGMKFDNPYKYESTEESFADAANKIKEIIG